MGLDYKLAGNEHRCEAGCGQMIEIGLALRFCAKCRLQQPIPQENKPRYKKKELA